MLLLLFSRESESEVAQSCPTLCDPIDCSLSGSSVHGIFQARVLEWITISFSRGSSQPRARTQVSRIVDRCFTVWATREVLSHVQLFCDPADCSTLASSVCGISQARILEWVAMSISRGSSPSRNGTCVSCAGRWIFTTESPGKPWHW